MIVELEHLKIETTLIDEKSKRMRKEKTDRDPDLEVSGHGHRSGGSQDHSCDIYFHNF